MAWFSYVNGLILLCKWKTVSASKTKSQNFAKGKIPAVKYIVDTGKHTCKQARIQALHGKTLEKRHFWRKKPAMRLYGKKYFGKKIWENKKTLAGKKKKIGEKKKHLNFFIFWICTHGGRKRSSAAGQLSASIHGTHCTCCTHTAQAAHTAHTASARCTYLQKES